MGHVQGQWPDINFKTTEGDFRVSNLGADKGISLIGYGNSPFVDTDMDAENALVLMLRLGQALGLDKGLMYTALWVEVQRRIKQLKEQKLEQEAKEEAETKLQTRAVLLSEKYYFSRWPNLSEGERAAMLDLAKAQIELEQKGK